MAHASVHPSIRIAGFFGILLFLLLGMLLIWREIPTPPKTDAVVTPTASSMPPVILDPNQRTCEAAGGKWVSCGNPCHGKDTSDESCVKVCEPQCICGGPEKLTCPAALRCTDYEPAGKATAFGVCRSVASSSVTTTIREIPAGMSCSEARDLCVRSSLGAVAIVNPLSVTGTAAGAERIIWGLMGPRQEIVASGTVPVVGEEGRDWKTFALREFFFTNLPSTGTGTLQLISVVQNRISPSSSLMIPVTWTALPSSTSRIFLSPKEASTDCSQTVPVDISAPRTAYPVEMTLRRLLKPTAQDLERGITNIPQGTRLLSLTVTRGVAEAMFSSELEAGGGGSCRVTAIRAQIEQTLLRFPSISSVILSVEGKSPEQTLQP